MEQQRSSSGPITRGVVGSKPAPATKYQTPRLQCRGVLFSLHVSCRLPFWPDFPPCRNIRTGSPPSAHGELQIQADWLQSPALSSKKADYAEPSVLPNPSANTTLMPCSRVGKSKLRCRRLLENCIWTACLWQPVAGMGGARQKDWEAGCSSLQTAFFWMGRLVRYGRPLAGKLYTEQSNKGLFTDGATRFHPTHAAGTRALTWTRCFPPVWLPAALSISTVWLTGRPMAFG